MREDILLIASLHILVIYRLTTLAVNPANIERAILQTTVKVFDVTHHPRHLNATFNCQFPTSFHLPTSAGATPGADFGETGNNHDLLKVNEAAQLGDVRQRLDRLKLWKLETEVGAWKDVHGLEKALSFNTIDDLEIGSIVLSYSTTKIRLLLQVGANAGGDIGKVWKAVHTTIKISPDGLNLSDTEKQWVH